ncbi:MAG TPA: hydrogenase nickel incorporation protein HypB [Vicinamibacterales bacterium]|nr:hydrogenase nickel incorporation protein HypB [Vicinamibacterales bacterium]
MNARRLALVGRNDLTHGELAARDLRHRFRQAGVFVASASSSPGAGKTALFERTLDALVSVYQIAAIAADPATDCDARRLALRRVPVRQITTGTAARLDAAMVGRVLDGWDLSDLDFLLIENVGSLIGSSAYDLGEDLRVVLVSVTEGADTPLKYPAIFEHADAAVVTKMDLADAVEFNGEALHANIEAVRPGVPVFEVSARTGVGMRDFLMFLETCRLERTLTELERR